VEILKIQEIKGYSAITPLPNAPLHVKGVLNLRGTIIPIVDLRQKFHLPAVAYDQFTVIVVVQVQGKILGFIVDAVSDVLSVTEADIQPTPDLHGQVDTACLNGLAQSRDKLVILLDIEKVLTSGDVVAAAEAAARN
jgi:purine-binding chemotaxis protein CheW